MKHALLIAAIVWLLGGALALSFDAKADEVEYLVYSNGKVQVCKPVESTGSTLRLILEAKGVETLKPCCDGFGVPDKGTPADSDCRICGIPSKGSPE